MKQHSSSSPSTGRGRFQALSLLGGTLLATGLFSGCGGSPAIFGTQSGAEGDIVNHPDTGLGSNTFVVEGNHGGLASEVEIQNIYWGRLVDVADSTGAIQNRDMVIGEDIRDGQVYSTADSTVVYSLSRNAVTEAWTVTIGALAGTSAYNDAFLNLDRNLTLTLNAGLEVSEMGPFSMTPRNSAMVIVFDDLLDPRFDDGVWKDCFEGNLINAVSGQLSTQSVKIRTGYPPETPFETRLILDKNHGDWADFDADNVYEFHSTRVIVATTVSEIEAAASNPPLPVNSVGLPASIDTSDANLALRIPTKLDPATGQTQLLVSPSGSRMAFGTNGSQDYTTSTEDLVRALRSGGESSVTGDLNNGFLLDEVSPEILGDFPVSIDTTPVKDEEDSTEYTLPSMTFSVNSCAPAPNLGDVLTQGDTKAEVIDVGNSTGATVTDLRVRVIVPLDGTLLPGSAQYLTPYDPNQELLKPCFVRFSPNAGTAPDEDVSSVAQVVLRFSKPMDPATISPFDTFTITRKETPPVPYDFAFGRVLPSPDLRVFTWSHTEVPFDNFLSGDETTNEYLKYYINLASGTDGPTDLAGNPLAASFEQIMFTLDPTEGSEKNGTIALRFKSEDEYGLITAETPDGQPDTFPELRNGQLLYDFQQERILPRPVSRYDSAADRNQPVPSVMTTFIGGIQTPLSPLGSKLHMVWRYCDLGFSLTDETNINVDVEGLSWAPVGSSVVTDTYDEFSVTVAHSAHLPDEFLDSGSGFPKYPFSGLKKTYDSNFLDLTEDPASVVHPRNLGYTVNPANLYTATSKTLMIPYPWNEDKAIEDYTYYTWRDTAILALGGNNGAGAPLAQEGMVTGGGGGMGQPLYAASAVPTIGLPLLMEFRVYPHDAALGLNAFDISLACNSSARPNFRAFSTGGYKIGGEPEVKDPDLEDEADGGFNPNSDPPGAPTPGVDCSFYIGEVQMVTRISRVHTIWFDTRSNDPSYVTPIIEPGTDDQPAGTQVILAFRGATDISNKDTTFPYEDIRTDANRLEYYGDTGSTPTGNNSQALYLNGDTTWKSDVSDINTAQYFQARISFISNTISNKTAELRTLAFAWRELSI